MHLKILFWDGIRRHHQVVRGARHKDPEKGMETHSSILAWKIPWTQKPGGSQFLGLHGVRHDWVTDRLKGTKHPLLDSNASHVDACVCAELLSCVQLLVILWTVACQIPLSMRVSRQEEYWWWLPRPPPGDLLHPGIKPMCPALAGGFFTTYSPGKPSHVNSFIIYLRNLCYQSSGWQFAAGATPDLLCLDYTIIDFMCPVRWWRLGSTLELLMTGLF